MAERQGGPRARASWSRTVLFPGPLLLVVAMSTGQALGTASLILSLLAIALDLHDYGEHDELGTAGSAGSGTGGGSHRHRNTRQAACRSPGGLLRMRWSRGVDR